MYDSSPGEDCDAFFFSAPPLTGPRRHATLSYVLPNDAAFHVRLRYARAGMICGFAGFIPGMLVREPIHGMQALLEKHSQCLCQCQCQCF
jgi:hypothetical protein